MPGIHPDQATYATVELSGDLPTPVCIASWTATFLVQVVTSGEARDNTTRLQVTARTVRTLRSECCLREAFSRYKADVEKATLDTRGSFKRSNVEPCRSVVRQTLPAHLPLLSGHVNNVYWDLQVTASHDITVTIRCTACT
jgi:hypothetical protein